MKILLDTHIWLWYCLGNPKLASSMRSAIEDPDNELWLSPISVWEALLLAEKGRIVLPPEPMSWVQSVLGSAIR
jgi:PIN domain nuclease of toxin-antitoxin system